MVEGGREKSERERKTRGREGMKGGVYVLPAWHPRALFILLSVRVACEHKGGFRGKKQFQYLAQKNFFQRGGENIDSWICIGSESNGNKLEDELSAVENNFYGAFGVIPWEWPRSSSHCDSSLLPSRRLRDRRYKRLSKSVSNICSVPVFTMRK